MQNLSIYWQKSGLYCTTHMWRVLLCHKISVFIGLSFIGTSMPTASVESNFAKQMHTCCTWLFLTPSTTIWAFTAIHRIIWSLLEIGKSIVSTQAIPVTSGSLCRRGVTLISIIRRWLANLVNTTSINQQPNVAGKMFVPCREQDTGLVN